MSEICLPPYASTFKHGNAYLESPITKTAHTRIFVP